MGALAHAVRSGKALYAGLSNYPAELTAEAAAILQEMGTPCSSTSRPTPCSPLDRGGQLPLAAELARGRHRLYRVLPAGAGPLTDRT